MSGVELIAVLGVAASAAQLIDSSLKVAVAISEIYNRVKEVPKRVVRYSTQINQIVAAAQAIEECRDLQTPLIDSQLQSTLREVRHVLRVLGVIRQDYTTGSSSKRVWKAIVGGKERRILACFERLEKEKTALILCISVVHTQALQTISTGVETLVNKDMRNEKDKIERSSFSSMVKCGGSKGKDPTVVPSESKTAVAIRSVNNSLILMVPDKPDSRNAQSSHNIPAKSKSKEGGASKKPSTFQNLTASKKAIQYNGNINENRRSSHIYNDIKASSGSFQHNGNRGGTGHHKHTNVHATKGAVQINGNIANRMTERGIKKLMGSRYMIKEDSDVGEWEESESEEEDSDERG